MPILTSVIFLLLGGAAGALAIELTSRVSRRRVLTGARREAEQVLIDAKDAAEHLLEETNLAATELSDEIWSRNEAEIARLETAVKEREEAYRRRRSESDRLYNIDSREIQKQLQVVAEKEKQTTERQAKLDQIKSRNQQLQNSLVAELQKLASLNPEQLKESLASEFTQQMLISAKRKATQLEDEVRANSEEIAKKLITNALARFHRPACTERGIGVVEIPNEDVKRRMLGENDRNIALLMEFTGLEISVNENGSFSVLGYDPVQRELATRTLEKLLHERAPNEETVRRLFEKTKSDVARKIEADGQRIAAELGQKDLHLEIKRTLGQLRYRYSFAQNQHFHVAEVGWLCGLLAAELGSVDCVSAKRAGLLHDIGKAMDHSIDGGHAVIGADFIEKHGEKSAVVHAVRAHHYEEQPASDLAFLTIAADAISGARPGARRSTVSVYNQKIETLTNIAEGFRGVNKTLILNAGREVRILVDGRRVNDEQSLRLCRDVADKIENECQYPGQIKVVVIRETHAEAMAK